MDSRHKNDNAREILSAYIAPLIPSSTLTGPHITQAKPQTCIVSYDTRHKLRVYVQEDTHYTFRRVLPISQSEMDFISQLFADLGPVWNSTGEKSVERAVDEAVARHVCGDNTRAFLDIVQVYTEWARQTPGHTHTTGLYHRRANSEGTTFYKLRNDPSVHSVASGPNMMLALGKNGEILKMERIPSVPTDSRAVQHLYSPLGISNVALWANSRHKTGIRLTALGEILVFKRKKLVFVKKSSFWRALPHSLINPKELPEIALIVDPVVQEAVYLTSMDLAFDRKNACIAILFEDPKTKSGLSRFLPNFTLDHKNLPETNSLFKATLAARKFQDIHRAIRAELCSLNGITVIDKEGTVAAIGVNLREGDHEDRLTRMNAIHSLANMGLGISISNEGHIGLYKGNNPPIVFT